MFALAASQVDAPPARCPHCSADLDAGPVPEAYRKLVGRARYTRAVRVDASVYGGVAKVWECPDCGRAWPACVSGIELMIAKHYLGGYVSATETQCPACLRVIKLLPQGQLNIHRPYARRALATPDQDGKNCIGSSRTVTMTREALTSGNPPGPGVWSPQQPSADQPPAK